MSAPSDLDALRALVCTLHAELPKNDLVRWTSGNVSARHAATSTLVIKPSGVRFEDLTPQNMVITDMDGNVIEGALKASSDVYTHAYIYRAMPSVGGVVHTHSAYASAWAACGEAIPCILTAMADEFGGPIPIGGFAPIGDQAIGREVVRVLDGHRSPAVLMTNHGVFTIGKDATAAVKAAVMVEDVAKTVFLARQLGTPRELPADDIDRLYERYQNHYGQKG